MSGLGALRAEVVDFLASEIAENRFVPRCNAWMDGHDKSFSARLGERGWIGMTWPVRYGGHNRSALERHAVTEELLAAGAPVAAHWFADRQVGPQLLRFGTEKQRARFLPGMARGECFFAVGMSEPDAGSDLAAVRTAACRVDGGWSLSGTKVWTSHARESDFMMTLCRTASPTADRHEGLSQLIVDLRSDGVSVHPIESVGGGSHFSEVVLDAVFVPDGDVVGELGRGWAQVTSELAVERSGPERFLSTMPLLEAAIVDLHAVPDRSDAERLGRVFARLLALRHLSLAVAGRLAAGEVPDVDAALVKDLGTRTEQDLVDELRLLTRPADFDGSRFYELLLEAQNASPGFTLRGGATEILRGMIGRELVGGSV